MPDEGATFCDVPVFINPVIPERQPEIKTSTIRKDMNTTGRKYRYCFWWSDAGPIVWTD
jgi:hypothetical protein